MTQRFIVQRLVYAGSYDDDSPAVVVVAASMDGAVELVREDDSARGHYVYVVRRADRPAWEEVLGFWIAPDHPVPLSEVEGRAVFLRAAQRGEP